ncbi:LysR family transcriptional regulator [Paenibacillus sp. 598K]|uniref:LysR family transcriptional regulator n=1 Tax=Paenibacillus sp. 598K TaxID=1117987 RepID=UPI000FFA2FC9|nr:LysR family transcriptional regulator [Paenibacillus sp. 598K]GBF72992.1 LysR family transcriptional regulator [Paenibacillus sp. 598K]
MNILKFRMLLLIERYKKATIVAEQLGMKQPTVSFHMKKMEEEWGIKLFEYKAGKIILTEAGRLVHHYAQRIVAGSDEAMARVRQMKRYGRGSLVIGCTDTALDALPDPPWLTLAASREEPLYHVRTGEHEALMDMLDEGRLDLLLTAQGEPESSRYQMQTILESPLALFVSESHPLVYADGQLGGVHLTAYPYLMLEDRSVAEAMMVWEAEQGLSLQPQLYADRCALLIDSLRRSQGIAILPEAAVAKETPGLRRLPLPGRAPLWRLQVLVPKQHWNLPLLGQTVERLRQG